MFIKNEKKVLLLNLNTWNNDLKGIYDYSTSSIKNEQTFIIKPTYLVRTKNNLFESREMQGLIDYNKEELIFSIRNDVKDNFSLINHIMKNMEVNETNSDYLNNKIWYVLKTKDLDNRENDINSNEEYYLNENDIIKIGKVKYVVQKINLLNNYNNNNEVAPAIPIIENNYKISELNKNTNPVFEFVFPVKYYNGYCDISEKNKSDSANINIFVCKYCNKMDKNEETDDGENFLISVCKCRQYVHFKCLKNYIKKLKEISNENKNKIKVDDSIIFKNFECPCCKSQYPIKFKLPENNKIFNLVDIEEPNDCNYMILESIDYKYNEQYCKSIHIIKFIKESGEPITIGREYDNDIVDRDVSISHHHAILRFNKENGKISIQNWKSKYGTLVLVKKPIKVLDKKIYLQVGRTYIEACLTDIEEYNKIKKEQIQLNKINEGNNGKEKNEKDNDENNDKE